jgi:hypothetical protein
MWSGQKVWLKSSNWITAVLIEERQADAVSDDVSNNPVPATRNQPQAGPSNQIELMGHAKHGNAYDVARLVRAGVDVNKRDEFVRTPLI